MRAEEIIIKGINRKINSTENNNGLCEEIINVRPENGDIKIIAEKSIVSANLLFTDIKIHKIGNTDRYIGILIESGTKKIVLFDHKTGNILQEVKSFPSTAELHFNFINNMLVICDKTDIELYVYIFTNRNYKLFYQGIDIDLKTTINKTSHQSETGYLFVNVFQPKEKRDYIEEVAATLNKFRDENTEFIEGNFLTAITLTLFDNSEIQLSNLTATIQNEDVEDGIDKEFISPIKGPHAQYLHAKIYVDRYYTKYTLSLRSELSLDKYKDLIKGINLYVSRPKTNLPINITTSELTGEWIFGDEPNVGQNAKVEIKKLGLGDSGISKELLYKQKTWNLEEVRNGITYTLKFERDLQTTGKTLEVMPSNISRAGEMFLYNDRLHFHGSKAKITTKPGDISLMKNGITTADSFIGNLYVYLRLSYKDLVLKYQNIYLPSLTRLPPYTIDGTKLKEMLLPMLIYPNSRAHKIILELDKTYVELNLSSAAAYNYSYCFTGNTSFIVNQSFEEPNVSNYYEENDILNVTASGNPFVFPVEHSYKFDGNIKDLGIATEQISETQIGQYPLEVFTDNGIYALEQGTGTVLYSNIIPVNSDQARSVVQTRQGLIYVAYDSIYLLSGRKNVKLSEVLEGPIDFDIQNNQSYALCCQGKLYNVSEQLCKIPFKEYIQDCELSYCANTEELLISNSSYQYTYVYSFLYNYWYKISGNYKGIRNNLMRRPVNKNTQSSQAATGKIVFENIYFEPAKKFISQCNVEFQNKTLCGAGENVVLIIDGKQVASASFIYPTKMPVVAATLCGNIPYLEDYTYMTASSPDISGELITIYCSLSSLVGKTIEIKNTTSGTTYLSKSFVSSSQIVDIKDKGYNSQVNVYISDNRYSLSITQSDSTITCLNRLANYINNSGGPVTASIYSNEIILTAKTAGVAGNNITLSIYNNIYTQITVTAMTGGEDITLRPGGYSEIVDFSEEKIGKQTIHIQTRPMLLNSTGYKTLYKALLRCKTSLTGADNLSMYIFASDNLKDWKCVQASQRKNCTISQLIVERVHKSYKYYVFIIGGIVNSITELSSIIINIDDKLNNKLR